MSDPIKKLAQLYIGRHAGQYTKDKEYLRSLGPKDVGEVPKVLLLPDTRQQYDDFTKAIQRIAQTGEINHSDGEILKKAMPIIHALRVDGEMLVGETERMMSDLSGMPEFDAIVASVADIQRQQALSPAMHRRHAPSRTPSKKTTNQRLGEGLAATGADVREANEMLMDLVQLLKAASIPVPDIDQLGQ